VDATLGEALRVLLVRKPLLPTIKLTNHEKPAAAVDIGKKELPDNFTALPRNTVRASLRTQFLTTTATA